MQVLLVDHNDCVRESFQTLLDNSQLSFMFYETAAQGMAFLAEKQPHVVVSDYFLPDMNGIEFLNRASSMYPGVYRILMTTIVTDELMEEISASGIDLLLEKPLSVASLDTILFNLKKEYGEHMKPGDKRNE
ncbi:MAG: response regulator [Desulfobacteraceae bacterium]|nr:MAG: response regulator [Desulfobacteraceae bacterium]